MLDAKYALLKIEVRLRSLMEEQLAWKHYREAEGIMKSLEIVRKMLLEVGDYDR